MISSNKIYSMLSRKCFLRLKRIAEADFEQFFLKHWRDTFDVLWSGLWATEKIRTTFYFCSLLVNTENGEERLKKTVYPSINSNLFPVNLNCTIAFTARGNQSFNKEIKINGEQVYFQRTWLCQCLFCCWIYRQLISPWTWMMKQNVWFPQISEAPR